MRVIIFGGDGYLGWPTSMHFAALGHEVWSVDNYYKRNAAAAAKSESLFPNPTLLERAEIFEAASGYKIHAIEGDCCDRAFMDALFAKVKPDAVIHYGEQPSAPYSMKGYKEAHSTLMNNLEGTLNVIWGVLEHAPDCHIIKLGTMGEYGTPNIDIEEGWLEVEHKGRKQKFLYPRQGGSLYHTTKIMDTDMLWFYVRTYGLRATDLMQGPVYGISTDQSEIDTRLRPHFHYDDIFGTVINRFMVQAICGVPLTVYGKGGQTRGYLNIRDTMQCVTLAMDTPPERGEMRVLNQFTEQFSINDIATMVQRVGNNMGLDVAIQTVPNPRKEAESHYYNALNEGFIKLGLKPHYLTDEVLAQKIEEVMLYKNLIDRSKIMPRVRWRDEGQEKAAKQAKAA